MRYRGRTAGELAPTQRGASPGALVGRPAANPPDAPTSACRWGSRPDSSARPARCLPSTPAGRIMREASTPRDLGRLAWHESRWGATAGMLGRSTEAHRFMWQSPAWRTLRRLAALLALLALSSLPSGGVALGEGITNAHDDLRDGWYPEQPSLTPQLVSGGTFGQLWSTNVDGQVYAQPLLANGSLLIATENNKVYALDPATGSPRWSSPLDLGTPWNPADLNCTDLTPHIGVTSTPVIDPATKTAYLTHKTYVSGSTGPARWYMDAIDLAKGTERAGFPVELSGAAQNQPSMTFQ